MALGRYKAGDNIQVHSIWDPGLGTRTQDHDQITTQEQEQKQDTGSGIGPEHRTSLWTKTQDQKLAQDTGQEQTGSMTRDGTRIENQSVHWIGTLGQAPETGTGYRTRT